MFALFNLGAQEMVVLGGCFVFVIAPVVVLLVVLPALRRRRPFERDDGLDPLERARAAAAVLTPQEREALRRSLDEQRPPPSGGGEGITQ